MAVELQVFAVRLFEGLTKCSDFRAVLGFQSGVFGGERGDDVVVGRVVSGGRIRCRSVLSPLVFDACSESSVVAEERVGDAGFALDGLECDGIPALYQAGDGGLGVDRLSEWRPRGPGSSLVMPTGCCMWWCSSASSACTRMAAGLVNAP